MNAGVDMGFSFLFFTQVICTVVIIYSNKAKIKTLEQRFISLMARLDQMDQSSNPR
jgi:hypothetical protein